VNSWSSPETIVSGHLLDQIDLLLWGLWSAAFVSAFPSPIQSEAFYVPSDDGVWLDNLLPIAYSTPKLQSGGTCREPEQKASSVRKDGEAASFCGESGFNADSLFLRAEGIVKRDTKIENRGLVFWRLNEIPF
jgi:hypothetical protein